MTEESNYVQWARKELERAGLFDEGSDYAGMLGESVMKLVKEFDGEGHSGYSAMMAASIFNRLAAWKPLTPITNDPDEWMEVSDKMGEECWQNRRMSSAFSTDGGQTYYDIDENQGRLRRFMMRRTNGWRWAKHHTAVSV